jgi:hypothetical protein
MQKRTYTSLAAALGIVAALALAAPALADTTSGTTATPPTTHAGWGQGGPMHTGMPGGMQRAPGVFGTVASISGTTLTVTSKMPQKKTDLSGTIGMTATAVTYTVDASNATVTKDNAASTVSAIAVGDTVMVQGTVSGTNVTAKTIRDGVMMQKGTKPGTPGQTGTSPAPIITGNGQPVVGGSVTAESGSILTITNKSNVTYSVDATSATIEKGNAASTLSSVAVGDTVIVQGAVNGSSITASSVIDQGATPAAGSTAPKPKGVMGFFSGIGGFFAHLFGF